jgi:hypothetical protein
MQGQKWTRLFYRTFLSVTLTFRLTLESTVVDGSHTLGFWPSLPELLIFKFSASMQDFKWKSSRLAELQGEFSERFFPLTGHAEKDIS